MRLRFTFTGVGGLTPIYVVVHGLEPDEMDDSEHPDDLYVVKILGLCPGGDTEQNPHGFGYVAFCNVKKTSTISNICGIETTFFSHTSTKCVHIGMSGRL